MSTSDSTPKPWLHRRPQDAAKLTDHQRFWEKVKCPGAADPAACWRWVGATAGRGYGYFRYNGKTRPAHRVAVALSSDAHVPDRMRVFQKCDTPACVRPGHLRVTSRGVTDHQRFWGKVDCPGASDPDVCWEWTGARFGGDFKYGWFGRNGIKTGAHRVSWALSRNRDVPEGMCILHHCDNPPCVRPSHLWLGTRADNLRDMYEKGRSGVVGEDNVQTSLTEDDVREIRAIYASGEASQQKIADRFGIGQMTVSRIVRRKTWAHV